MANEKTDNEKIEEILTSRGYKKLPPDSRFGVHGNFDAFVEFAQDQLSGKNRNDDAPHQGLGLFFERDVMNVLAENSKSYFLVDGQYTHFYELFDNKYKGMLTTGEVDGETGVVKTGTILDDLLAYNETNAKTKPGFTSDEERERHFLRVVNAKARFLEPYHTELGGDRPNEGEWYDAISTAQSLVKPKPGAKKASAPRYRPPFQATDRARKRKKELADKRRLTQQSLLLLNLYELSGLNRDVYRPKGYDNFVCIEDGEPSTFMSRLMGINFLPLSRIKNNEMSSLVPEMRFFKVVHELNRTTKEQKPIEKREVFFPTFAGADQKTRYSAGLMTDFNTLIADGSPNIGVKNVEWSNRSGNALMEKSSVQFNIQIYAERISDLFAKVVGQTDDKFRYSDLFTFSSLFLDNETDKPKEERVHNPDYYRLQAQFGWRISERAKRELFSTDPKAKERLEQIADFKMTVDLSLVNFDLDFGEDGSVNLNLTYNSFIESYTKNNEKTNVLLSSEEMKLHQELRKLTAKAEKEKSKTKKNTLNEVGNKRAATRKTREDIAKVQKNIKDTQSNLNTRFSSIIKRLVEKNSIRSYTVKDDEILARYQMAGAELRTISAKSRLMSVQKQFNTDDYEELSIIEVSDPSAEVYKYDDQLLPILNTLGPAGVQDFLQNRGFAFLKKVRKKSSGKEFYLYYVSGSNVASTIPGIHDNEFIPVSKLRGKIGKFQPTAIRNTASSVKGQSKSGDEANTSVQNVPNSKKIASQAEQNLDKAVEELSRKYYNSTTKEFNVKFFYLGDLIDVAVESLYEHGGASRDMKIVASSVALKNFVGYDALENFNVEVDSTGVLSVSRTASADKEIERLSQGKSTAQLQLDAKYYYRCIADIPISLSAFMNTFNDLVVKKKKINLSFHEMIKMTYKMAMASLNSIDDEFYILPRQGLNLSQTIISAPRLKSQDYGYFGERKKTDKKLEFENQVGRKSFDDIRAKAPVVLSDSQKPEIVTTATNLQTTTSLFEQRFRASAATDEGTDGYIILHDIPRTIPPHKISNFEIDNKNGIPHFFIGASSGLVKNIKFSLKENALLQADQMLRRADRTYPKFPIKGIYEAEVTMLGNVFFSPGSIIYINPAAMKLGNPKNPNSPINALGISGYYLVLRTSSYIQEGTYETKLNCKFQSPGNGFDKMGTNYINVPTREEINKRKERRGK